MAAIVTQLPAEARAPTSPTAEELARTFPPGSRRLVTGPPADGADAAAGPPGRSGVHGGERRVAPARSRGSARSSAGGSGSLSIPICSPSSGGRARSVALVTRDQRQDHHHPPAGVRPGRADAGGDVVGRRQPARRGWPRRWRRRHRACRRCSRSTRAISVRWPPPCAPGGGAAQPVARPARPGERGPHGGRPLARRAGRRRPPPWWPTPMTLWWCGRQARPPKVVWVAAGQLWRRDAVGCPACDGPHRLRPSGDWWCACGFRRPQPRRRAARRRVRRRHFRRRHPRTPDGRSLSFRLSLPGRCNRANAAMAAVAAGASGSTRPPPWQPWSGLGDVEGRFATVEVRDTRRPSPAGQEPGGMDRAPRPARGGPRPCRDRHQRPHRRRPRPVVAVGRGFRAAGGPVGGGHGGAVSRPGRAPPLRRCGACHRARRARRPGGARGRHAWSTSATTPPSRTSAGGCAPSPPPPGTATAHGDRHGSRVGRRHRAGRGPHRGASSPVVRSTRRGGPGVVGAGRGVEQYRRPIGAARGGGAPRPPRHLRRRRERARCWRRGPHGAGIPVELVHASSDAAAARGRRLYCLGGGEDGPQVQSAERLRDGVLAGAVARGAVVLAVCAGYQIIGQSFRGTRREVARRGRPARRRHREGHGAPCRGGAGRGTARRWTGLEQRGRRTRRWRGAGDASTLTGFENHGAVTRLGAGARPFARVLTGVGNGNEAHDEGACAGRVIGTYLHGPALARNPSLADLLLTWATGAPVRPLDDAEEGALRAERLAAPGRGTRPHRPRWRRAAVTLLPIRILRR